MNNFAHIKTDSPWHPIFPNGLAPIKNILVPSTGNMIGGGGVQEFYDLDLEKITPEQKRKIFVMMGAVFKCSPEEVEKGVIEQGRLPLRAIHVTSVTTDSRAFL